MPKARLLKSRLQAEQAAIKIAGGRLLLWDTDLAGFGARISARNITFVVRYQHGPVERRMTLGTLAEFGTVEAARKKAADIRLEVRDGHDPLAQIREGREAVERGITLGGIVDRWAAASR